MSEGEGPKLYTNKPKKEKIKHFQEQEKAKEFSSPSSSSAASAMGPRSTSPPPRPPQESFGRRYKFLWPTLLAVNFAVGAYLFMRTKKKDTGVEEEDTTPISTKDATIHSGTTPVSSLPFSEPVIKREPIPEDQQRELFKWILEEKRKVKPKDPEEKRRIDEEKAVLKQFIQAKSIPKI